MDLTEFSVKDKNTGPNKYIIKFKEKHPDFFNIEFSELKKKKRVGSGAFGTVYRVEYRNKYVAAKRIDTNGGNDTYKYLSREILNLRKLHHQNILEYIGLAHEDLREVYLITDFVDGLSLDKMKKKIRKNYAVITEIAAKIAFGMRYMNSINMLHRDLKLANVLVSHDMETVKICDFGMSLQTDLPLEETKNTDFRDFRKMTMVGSGNYMAPEMKTGKGNYSSDVYSFGVLLANLLGYPSRLVKKKFNKEVFAKKVDREAPNDLVTLVHLCTEENSKKRPPFSRIAKGLADFHRSFFSGIRPPLVDEDLSRIEELSPASGALTTQSSKASIRRKRSLARTRSAETLKSETKRESIAEIM